MESSPTNASVATAMEPSAQQSKVLKTGGFSLWGMICDPLFSVVLLTILAGLLIGFAHDRVPPFWDEVRTWQDSRAPYLKILAWRHNPDHAPLSYLLVKASRQFLGFLGPDLSLRLPSMICGVLCVPAAYALGKRVWSKWAGVLMALFVAVDWNLIWQSTQARMYSMLMLITLLSLQLMVKLIRDKQARIGWWLLGGLLLAIGMWTHFSSISLWAGFAVAAIGLLCDSAVRKRAIVGALGMSLIVAGLTSVSLMRLKSLDSNAPISVGRGGDILLQLEQLGNELAGAWVLSLVCLGMAVTGLVILYHRDRLTAAALLVIAIASVAGLLVAAQYRPVHGARYITVAQPVWWVGISIAVLLGLQHLPRLPRGVLAAALAGMVVFQFYRSCNAEDFTRTHTHARNYMRAATFLRNQLQPGDQVLYAPCTSYSLNGMYRGLYYSEDFYRDMRDVIERSPRLQREAFAGAFKHWRDHPTWVLVMSPVTQENGNAMDDPWQVLPMLGRLYRTNVSLGYLRRNAVPRITIARISRDGVQYWDTSGKPLPFPPASPDEATTQPDAPN